jgi:hypothetical protein
LFVKKMRRHKDIPVRVYSLESKICIRGPMALAMQEDEGMTLKNIGKRFGVSATRAQQYVMYGFRLRAALEAQYLDPWSVKARGLLKIAEAIKSAGVT